MPMDESLKDFIVDQLSEFSGEILEDSDELLKWAKEAISIWTE